MNRFIRRLRRMTPGDWLRLIDRLIPHIAIIISGMLVVFFLIDRVNKPIGFMTNEFHKRITFALALLAIYLGIRRTAQLRRQARDDYARRARAARQRQPAQGGYAAAPRAPERRYAAPDSPAPRRAPARSNAPYAGDRYGSRR